MIALSWMAPLAAAAPTLYAVDASPDEGWRLAAGPGFTVIAESWSPNVRADVAWSGERWGARAVSTGYLPATPELFVVGGVRYRVWSGERLSVAPTLSAVEHVAGSALDHRVIGRLGVALERDGERVDLYASLPLVGLTYYPSPDVETRLYRAGLFETLLALEAGVDVAVVERHAIRAGLTGFMPTLGYRLDAGGWFIDAALSTAGLAHMGSAQAGVRL